MLVLMKKNTILFSRLVLILLICLLFTSCGFREDLSEPKISETNNSLPTDIKLPTDNSEIDNNKTGNSDSINNNGNSDTDDITETDKAVYSDDKQSDSANEKSDFREMILSSSYSGEFSEREEKGEQWANMWLEHTYGDYGIKDASIEYLSGAHFNEFSNKVDICPNRYLITFLTNKPVDNLEKTEEGNYEIEVLVAIIYDKVDKKIVLSGFLEPGEFSEYDALPVIYDLISKDHRFASYLDPFPEVKLPKEFLHINVNRMFEISEGQYIISTHTMPGGIVAAVCGSVVPAELKDETENEVREMSNDKDETEDKSVDESTDENVNEFGNEWKYHLNVVFYGINTVPLVKNVEIGEYLYPEVEFFDGKIVIKTQKSRASDVELIYVDKDGNTSIEKYSQEKNHILYSPDKSKYAYTINASLYVADASSDTGELMIEGIDFDIENPRTDIKSYYPYAWMDESRLIYGIGGYEWYYGFGILDVTTGKNIYLNETEEYTFPIAYKNGKLYLATGHYGVLFDPIVIDLKDPDYRSSKVFNNREFVEKLMDARYAFSPDGTKITILKTSYDPYKTNILYIYSIGDGNGSLLKTYEFSTAFNRPQYLDFFENNKIAIYSEQYAYSAKYMYIVEIP
jgi:hypothetical protein